ncbi:MAG: hypothetical protein GXO43_01570 [Crenarchaeota archaeon]|nr:hypothetical protein [Thermoproteota archaeon]
MVKYGAKAFKASGSDIYVSVGGTSGHLNRESVCAVVGENCDGQNEITIGKMHGFVEVHGDAVTAIAKSDEPVNDMFVGVNPTKSGNNGNYYMATATVGILATGRTLVLHKESVGDIRSTYESTVKIRKNGVDYAVVSGNVGSTWEPVKEICTIAKVGEDEYKVTCTYTKEARSFDDAIVKVQVGVESERQILNTLKANIDDTLRSLQQNIEYATSHNEPEKAEKYRERYNSLTKCTKLTDTFEVLACVADVLGADWIAEKLNKHKYTAKFLIPTR